MRKKRCCIISSRFSTISSQFFAIYISIFHKTEVLTIILKCWTGLNHNWFKSYDTKRKWGDRKLVFSITVSFRLYYSFLYDKSVNLKYIILFFRIGLCGAWSFDAESKICYLHSVNSCCNQINKSIKAETFISGFLLVSKKWLSMPRTRIKSWNWNSICISWFPRSTWKCYAR